MAKSRTCPHCRRVLQPDEGFTFDAKLNLLCGHCGKIVVPVDRAAEAAPATYGHPGYAGPGGPPRYGPGYVAGPPYHDA